MAVFQVDSLYILYSHVNNVSTWFMLQSRLEASRKKWEEEIEMGNARSENLFDRLNDLSDTHQDELTAVKQVSSLTTIYYYLRYMARTKQRRTYLPYTFPAVAGTHLPTPRGWRVE